jgi:Flp pilus assembly protein TadG
MRLSNRNLCENRIAAATVELAVVLPVLIAVVFGMIEICQRLHVKQSSLIAAYEACRVSTRPTSDTAIVRGQAESLLTQQNVRWTSIEVKNLSQAKNNLDGVVTGDEICIQVTVPWSSNTISNYVIPGVGSFQVSANMLRE